jgi:hypothetical protein
MQLPAQQLAAQTKNLKPYHAAACPKLTLFSARRNYFNIIAYF